MSVEVISSQILQGVWNVFKPQAVLSVYKFWIKTVTKEKTEK